MSNELSNNVIDLTLSDDMDVEIVYPTNPINNNVSKLSSIKLV